MSAFWQAVEIGVEFLVVSAAISIYVWTHIVQRYSDQNHKLRLKVLRLERDLMLSDDAVKDRDRIIHMMRNGSYAEQRTSPPTEFRFSSSTRLTKAQKLQKLAASTDNPHEAALAKSLAKQIKKKA